MSHPNPVRARRALLCHAIAVALVGHSVDAGARVLNPGEMYTVTAGGAPEAWAATAGARLTLNPSVETLRVDLSQSTLVANNASIRSTVNNTSDVALWVTNGSTATVNGGSVYSQFGTGLAVVGVGGSDGGDETAQAVVSGASVVGATRGVTIGNGGSLVASAAQITGTGAGSAGVAIFNGTATLTDGTHASGVVNGATLSSDSRGGDVGDQGRHLVVDGAIVEGGTGAAVRAQYFRAVDANGSIVVTNGGQLIGGNGRAIDIDRNMNVTVDVSTSTITGDIQAGLAATATVHLGDRGVLAGAMNGGDIHAVIDGTGLWQAAAPSSVASLQLDGGLAFSAGGTYKTVDVRGDLTGGGGTLRLNTQLNDGGATANQFTDRLLVRGDVTTTGTTLVTVAPTGDGALTDVNRDGAVDANEGISIIQVGGASRANAFALAGGYVAAGPYQYTLHAFGPGEVDPAQNVLPDGTGLNWDYRLGNRYVKDCGDDCDPVTPPVDPVDPTNPVDPVNPIDPPPAPDPVDRVAVVPQLPSYMLAPMALQNYGNTINDGLHQRLGEIRDSVYGANAGGEVFARYVGSQLNYSRNLSFQRYGYDFDQQINALQVGASIVSVDDDQGSLRAGWALDSGSTRVTPSAADGNSRAKYYANGGSAWVTWQHGRSGMWIDGVLGVTRYHGDVSTDLRGEDVGKLHAQGWTASIETGVPLPLGGDWTVEPQFQLRLQQLNFRDFRDKDGLDIRLGNSVQTTSRLGVQVSRVANLAFSPYARLDLIHTSNGNPSLTASSEAWGTGDAFQTGKTGNAYRVAAGLTSQLTDHVQLYGEGNYQHYVGGFGLKGWTANAGVRVTF